MRAWLAITSSVLVFALLIERTGLVSAVVATALVASLGAGTTTIREALICALCLAAAIAILFVGVLDQPFLLFPGY
jgi:hypothetical protein